MIPYRQILYELEQLKIKEKKEFKNNIRPYLTIIRDNMLLRLRKGKNEQLKKYD